jgi:hypothetical protein
VRNVLLSFLEWRCLWGSAEHPELIDQNDGYIAKPLWQPLVGVLKGVREMPAAREWFVTYLET